MTGIMPRLFGDKLRSLRLAVQMSQVDLARHLGLASHSHISYLENGHNAPSLELAVNVAGVFGVATDYLLRDSVPVNQPITCTVTASDKELAQRFGTRLRQLRLQHGMTQVELAA